MADDGPQGILRRLRQQAEAQIGAGIASISQLQSLIRPDIEIDSQHHYNVFLPKNKSKEPDECRQRDSEALEAILDLCRGRGEEHHDYGCRLFCERSEYSPFRLDEQLSKRPRPADLEGDMERHMLSWRDPFEDLLAASSALPMPNSRERYSQRKLWLTGTYDIEPWHMWWGRLRSKGLHFVLFPIDEPDYHTPRTSEEWVQVRKRNLERETASKKAGWPARDRTARQDEPETELDLYDRFDTILGQIFWRSGLAVSRDLAISKIPGWPRPASGEVVNGESLKTTETTKQWVEDGMVHMQTERKKTAADGREVQEERITTVRPATPEELEAGGQGQQTRATTAPSEETGEGRYTQKGSSWIWK